MIDLNNNNIREVRKEIQPDGSVKIVFHNTKPDSIKEPVNNANKPENKPEKKLRYSNDSFTKELIGQAVKLTFINGNTIQGILKELGMYDCKIHSDRDLIVMKAHILLIEVV